MITYDMIFGKLRKNGYRHKPYIHFVIDEHLCQFCRVISDQFNLAARVGLCSAPTNNCPFHCG